ncbi:hypothetical protein BLOT_000289 [Blomia tropicalis]|nr:hypothetical protein BLOT_000289 [Blomia tropicalis]
MDKTCLMSHSLSIGRCLATTPIGKGKLSPHTSQFVWCELLWDAKSPFKQTKCNYTSVSHTIRLFISNLIRRMGDYTTSVDSK